MGRYLVGVVLWVGALVQAAAAQRSVQVKVAATEPASEATLGSDQSFYVRIEYTSDEPVKLWARPFLHGKEAPAMSNPSREYVGSGYALGWFAFREPAEVDEIRIEAGGGEPYREWVVASYPVKLRWTADAAEPRGAAPWVAQLRAEDAAAERAAMQARMNEPVSTGDSALMQGFMLAVLGAVLGGIIAPIWAFRKWHGGWRIAAVGAGPFPSSVCKPTGYASCNLIGVHRRTRAECCRRGAHSRDASRIVSPRAAGFAPGECFTSAAGA